MGWGKREYTFADECKMKHGMNRLWERFGLGPVDYITITEIMNKENYKHPDVLMHEFVESYSDRRKKHFLVYKNIPIYLIYDKKRHFPITFF